MNSDSFPDKKLFFHAKKSFQIGSVQQFANVWLRAFLHEFILFFHKSTESQKKNNIYIIVDFGFERYRGSYV